MKTLILDNYDSFTYNLYQLVAGLADGSRDDLLPTVLRNDEVGLDSKCFHKVCSGFGNSTLL